MCPGATRRRELIAAVRTAVEVGIPLTDLQSLADLLRHDRAEAILDHYWRKNGQTPSLYTIDLAARIVELARSQPSLGADDFRLLEGMRQSLRRVLGHRNIQTTINFYIGLETLEATRRFANLVTELEVGSDTCNQRGKAGRRR